MQPALPWDGTHPFAKRQQPNFTSIDAIQDTLWLIRPKRARVPGGRFSEDRGRDGRHRPPPAQIRT